MSTDLADVVRRVCAHHRQGSTLTEPEAQEITRTLGLGVPRMLMVRTPGEPIDLPRDRVVVKAVGPAHKAALGGVRIAANTSEDIAAAIRSIATTITGTEEFLVAEFVDHAPDAELIAGVRWTDAFGPVVSIGRGGVGVEQGPPPAIVSAATTDRMTESLRAAVPRTEVGNLRRLVLTLLELGRVTMPHDLIEFEMNPVVFTPTGPVALDALAVAGSGVPVAPWPSLSRDAIVRQLHPQSIAVIGVSEQMNPGRVILHNILAAGFPPDRVVVIKPGTDEIDGCRAVADLTALDDPVDLLVVAVPAAAVPAVVEQAIATGAVRSMVLIPGGLGERPGTEAAAERIRTALAAKPGGVVITGPNSMGIRSIPGGFDATFIPPERMTPRSITPPLWGSDRGEAEAVGGEPVASVHAPLAVIAQSGAFTLSRLDRIPWLHPDYVVTVGNQLDLTIGDYLEYFAADPAVAIAACYVEGFHPGDGDRILRAATAMRSRGGLVIWYRGGRTAAGSSAAATHTAAIATDDIVARALAGAAGILEAGSLDDFDDLLRIAVALHGRSLGEGRLTVVSNAGFECVAAADSLGDLAFAGFSPTTRTRITAILGGAGLDGVVGIQNPLDLTPMADDAAFADTVAAVLDDPGVDVVVVGCVPFTGALHTLPEQVGWPGSLPDRLAALAGHPTPWLAVVDGGRQYDPMADHLEAAGIAVVREMDRAVRLVGQYLGR